MGHEMWLHDWKECQDMKFYYFNFGARSWTIAIFMGYFNELVDCVLFLWGGADCFWWMSHGWKVSMQTTTVGGEKVHLKFRALGFETTHHHMKQIAHNSHLPYCQCKNTCSHVSSIPKIYIYQEHRRHWCISWTQPIQFQYYMVIFCKRAFRIMLVQSQYRELLTLVQVMACHYFSQTQEQIQGRWQIIRNVMYWTRNTSVYITESSYIHTCSRH